MLSKDKEPHRVQIKTGPVISDPPDYERGGARGMLDRAIRGECPVIDEPIAHLVFDSREHDYHERMIDACEDDFELGVCVIRNITTIGGSDLIDVRPEDLRVVDGRTYLYWDDATLDNRCAPMRGEVPPEDVETVAQWLRKYAGRRSCRTVTTRLEKRAGLDDHGMGYHKYGWYVHGELIGVWTDLSSTRLLWWRGLWECYACGIQVERGKACECGREAPPHIDEPLDLMITDGRFRCPLCGEIYPQTISCPTCGVTYAPLPSEADRGIARGKQYTEEQAPHGLDPIERLPIELDSQGNVLKPRRYRLAQRKHRAWQRRKNGWEKKGYRRIPLAPVVVRIFPEVEPLFDPPLCRRCKLPRVPPRAPRRQWGRQRAREPHGGGMCRDCIQVERDLLSPIRGSDEPTPREIAMRALAYQDENKCSEAVAARQFGWDRQRLNYWKQKLVDELAEDIEQWNRRARGRREGSYWAVKLERECQRDIGID